MLSVCLFVVPSYFNHEGSLTVFPISPPSPCKNISRLCSFAKAEDGAVLVLWALFLAVALGFLALSFDLGRVASTQSELQSYADQVALAAAGELDTRPDAITRATAAAAGLIRDRQTYASGSTALGGAGSYTITFLNSLPTTDRAADTFVTTDPRLARYVRVQTTQKTVQTPFASVNAAMTGQPTVNVQSNVRAEATAGMTSFACDVTPLMFCAPDASWRASANIGDLIQLRSVGGNSQWGPGNFGFLDPTTLPVDQTGPCRGMNQTGAQYYRCLIGAERAITACIQTDKGLTSDPGQRGGLARAFDFRFDIYQGANSYRNDARYRPAPNTIQGTLPQGGGSCRGNNLRVSDAMALPLDNCLQAGNCSPYPRFGDGNWNRTAYVNKNHRGAFPAGTSLSSTRYQIYLAEIAAARTNTPAVPLPGFQETGAAMCHPSGATPEADRRTVIAAAVDCNATRIAGRTENIVPLEYVKLFMIRPINSDNNDFDIFVEVVNTAGGVGSGAITGVYNDFIQLYR